LLPQTFVAKKPYTTIADVFIWLCGGGWCPPRRTFLDHLSVRLPGGGDL